MLRRPSWQRSCWHDWQFMDGGQQHDGVRCTRGERSEVCRLAVVAGVLGQHSFLGYGIDADRAGSLSLEQLSSRLNDAFTSGGQLAHVSVYTE